MKHARSNLKSFLRKLSSQRYLYYMLIPGIIWFIIFCYVPMSGIVIAFKEYNLGKGIWGSDWVGMKYFMQFLTSYSFPIILRNTVCISLLKLFFCFPAPIILALLLNELNSLQFKKFVQTASYLPYFISWAIVLGIWGRMLSADGGVFNTILIQLHLISNPITFMQTSQYMWSIAVITELWKGLGFGTIIYLAAITSINPELYEAAKIDGAGRFKQVWHITLPGIKSIIAILLIFNMGSIFSANFDQLYILGTSPVLDVTEVIDTYIFRYGLKNFNYSLGTAAGLMRSVIAFLLVVGANKIAHLCGEDGIW
jgi:putative aldouronate transport system permease protein